MISNYFAVVPYCGAHWWLNDVGKVIFSEAWWMETFFLLLIALRSKDWTHIIKFNEWMYIARDKIKSVPQNHLWANDDDGVSVRNDNTHDYMKWSDIRLRKVNSMRSNKINGVYCKWEECYLWFIFIVLFLKQSYTCR